MLHPGDLAIEYAVDALQAFPCFCTAHCSRTKTSCPTMSSWVQPSAPFWAWRLPSPALTCPLMTPGANKVRAMLLPAMLGMNYALMPVSKASQCRVLEPVSGCVVPESCACPRRCQLPSICTDSAFSRTGSGAVPVDIGGCILHSCVLPCKI